MKIIKISLSFCMLFFSLNMFSQAVFNLQEQITLTQDQVNKVKDFSREKSHTVTNYSFDNNIFETSEIGISYQGVDYLFKGSKAHVEKPEEFSWLGDNGQDNSSLNLYVKDGKITGGAVLNGIQYEIQTIGDQMMILYESPTYNIEYNDQVEPPKEDLNDEDNEHKSLAGPGECKVRILVAYSNQANLPGRDFALLASARINQMNTGLNNSLVAHDVVLARVAHIDFDEPTTITQAGCTSIQCQALYDLVDHAELNDLRDLYDADVVMVIINQGSGIAFREPGSEWAYGTVSWNNFNSISSRTFGHEVGHTYGCRHNTEEDPEPTDNHGYNADLDIGESWRTILSYSSGCSSCNRIDHYSNPNQTYLGDSTGPDPNSHDCAGQITDRASAVADFRNSPNHKTLTTDNLNNTDDYAYVYGHVSLTTNGNYTVGNGAEAKFQATNQISINNGFQVNTGGEIDFFLGNCGPDIPDITDDEILVESRSLIKGELEELVNLTIFPNPMNTNSVLEFYNPITQNVSLFVTDMNGKLIHSYHEDDLLVNGTYTYQMNDMAYSSGVYLCTMIMGEELVQKNFVVMK